MRLKLVPQNTSFDFFSRWKLWLGISAFMMLLAAGSFLTLFAIIAGGVVGMKWMEHLLLAE